MCLALRQHKQWDLGIISATVPAYLPTVITCQPNAVMAPIHNRMPVILLPEDDWLNPNMTEAEEIKTYLRPYSDELLMGEPDA